MSREIKIEQPNLVNTRHIQFQGLLGEPIRLLANDGATLETDTYELLKCLIQNKGIDVQRVYRNYYQALSRMPLSSVEGVDMSLSFQPDQILMTSSSIWLPQDLELIGPGTGALAISMYEIEGRPKVQIQGSDTTPTGVQREVSEFFFELGALAN